MEAHQIWDVNFKKFTQFIKVKVTPRGQIKVQCINTLKIFDSRHLCCRMKILDISDKNLEVEKGGGASYTFQIGESYL